MKHVVDFANRNWLQLVQSMIIEVELNKNKSQWVVLF